MRLKDTTTTTRVANTSSTGPTLRPAVFTIETENERTNVHTSRQLNDTSDNRLRRNISREPSKGKLLND